MKFTFTSLTTTNLNKALKATLLLFVFFSFAEISNAQQTVTFTLVKQPCNNDGILVASITTGTPPITFTWNGGTSTVTHISNALNDTLHNYSGSLEYVSAYNNSMQASGKYAGSPPFKDTIITTTAVCPALGSAQANITGGTSPFTIQWADASGTIVATGNPVSLPAGTYSYTITDAAGCVFGSFGSPSGSNYVGVYIQNVSPVAFTVDTTNAKCTNGSAKVVNVTGGTGPYTYKWSNGANTQGISGLTMGNYNVTVTDGQGCYNSKYVYIFQSPTLTAHTTPTNATCLQNDGSIIAFGSGGKPPYSYSWANSQTTATITGLVAGYYPLTVSDINGCLGWGGASVTAATPITVTYTTTASACTVPTGTATLNITGGTSPYNVKWYTYPIQTGVTANGLPPGQYSFLVTDANGCVRNGTAYIPPVSVITASVSESDAVCTQTNGSAGVLVLTGQNPYTYSWTNGATSSSIGGLSAGSYTVTITDKLSCSVIKTAIVKVASPIQLSLTPTQSSCLFIADGSIATSISGGTPPYSYNWTNGETSSNATGLLKGRYYLYVSDAAGCSQSAWTDVPYNAANDSCYCTITGRVFVDANNNCAYDSGEVTVPNIMIHCSGLGYAFTDSKGVYSFPAPTGSYTLSENVQAYYPLASCQSNSIPVNVTAASGCFSHNDFANIINPIHDVRITTTNFNPPILGKSYLQKVVVENNGSITEPDIQLGYAHDGQLILTGENPALFTQQNAGGFPNWYSITSGFPSVAPGAYQAFDVNYNVPANIPLGTSVLFNDTVAYTSPIANWLNDYSPWDNVNSLTNTVVGSFDPNDKEVSPKGTGAQGFITTEDSVLTYTVHFQNTGTWLAENIVVVDTLDPNLDITTLKPGYSNHTYTTMMSNSGVATFTFNNINLPDSIGQPLASIGVLMYSAHLKHGLTGGTQIKSPASIYFDFNAPVKTNNVLNTLNIPTNIINNKGVFDLKLYPNPASNSVYVLVNTDETNPTSSIKFYNLVGQLVKAQTIKLEKGKNVIITDVSSLPTGMYFVEIAEGKRTHMQKLNVVK